jgi:cytidylate kinase
MNSTAVEFGLSRRAGSTVTTMRGTVTLSRLYGAGGIRVAKAVAEALGWRTVDRDLVEEAAGRLGVDPRLAVALDEKVPALIEEAGLALAAAERPPVPVSALDDRALAEAVRAVIVSLADAGGYVILGRGGQAALREHPNTVHIQLSGDLEDRAARVAESQGVTQAEARARCRRVDEERAAYVQRFYGADIRDPLLYDAILNTSRLGVDGAARVVLEITRDRLGVPAGEED